MVIEGLAESFSKKLYGENLLEPWVTSFDKEDLEYSIEVIKDALHVKGFAGVSSYMFGDTIRQRTRVPACWFIPFAGYAVGYQVVQSFIKK
ncbi:DUF2268 domain-containing putative Zn-dependent protease [Aeribacillus sp. FSL K6-1305]|uniref:DUF2268 domain-containing putative Zn-dependent protease n=1 Tax=Aeribacillus sp. FSL K6-1305 TaxID=2954569 RepID=UPI0030FDA114